MKTAFRWLLLIVGLLAAVLLIGRAEMRARQLGLVADSLAATLDTTRTLLVVERGILGDSLDSLTLTRRRALQVSDSADRLDRILGDTRAANGRLVLAVRRLELQLSAPVTAVDSGDDVRAVALDVREPPYHVTGALLVPRPPASADVRLAVAIDSAPFRIRIGCGKEGAGGVRPAEVTVAGPPWLAVSFPEPFTVDPDVCSPPRTLERIAALNRRGPFRSVLWTAIGTGAGALAGFVAEGELGDAVLGAGLGGGVGLAASVALP